MTGDDQTCEKNGGEKNTSDCVKRAVGENSNLENRRWREVWLCGEKAKCGRFMFVKI